MACRSPAAHCRRSPRPGGAETITLLLSGVPRRSGAEYHVMVKVRSKDGVAVAASVAPRPSTFAVIALRWVSGIAWACASEGRIRAVVSRSVFVILSDPFVPSEVGKSVR